MNITIARVVLTGSATDTLDETISRDDYAAGRKAIMAELRGTGIRMVKEDRHGVELTNGGTRYGWDLYTGTGSNRQHAGYAWVDIVPVTAVYPVGATVRQTHTGELSTVTGHFQRDASAPVTVETDGFTGYASAFVVVDDYELSELGLLDTPEPTADVPADYDPEQTYADALDYVREVRPELVDEPATLAELEAARERAAANLAELFGDGEAADDVERCPVCGDPADYCQGHGETGDPRGWRKMIAHDHGDHTECHSAGCEAAGTTEHADYPHEVGYLDACEACTSGPCVCCESDSLAPCVSVNCEHPADDGEADDEQRYPEWTERPADGEAIEPDTGRRFGGALAVLVVLAVWFVAGLFAPVSPSAYASPVAEDSPEWNCATMGDHECGPRPAVAPVVPPHCFPMPGRPGNTLWVMLTPSGVAGCTADGR